MDTTRAQLNDRGFRLRTLLHGSISNPVTLRRMLRSIQWLRPFVSSIPKLAPASELGDYYPAARTREGAVGLFKGCSAEAIEPRTLRDAIMLLNHAARDVHIPLNQVCCGALHAHAGDWRQAAMLTSTNERAFSDQPFETLVSIATGCGAYLSEDEQFPVSHMDICAFLARPEIIRHFSFRPLKARVALHIPCSLKNVLGNEQAVLDLLGKIPALEVRILNSDQCCGAAGTYFIFHRKTAGKLRQPVVEQIEQLAPDFLLGGNIGCTQHIIQGLGGKPPRMMHPVSLLAQQLVVN